MKNKISKLSAIALALSLMISAIAIGTEGSVYADTQNGFTISMGTDGESAEFSAFCTENGFSMLPGGRFALSVYDMKTGDEVYYYNKKTGLTQRFRVTDVTDTAVELMFTDHLNEMEQVNVSNINRNGFAQTGFLSKYSNWAMNGEGKKYFYGAITDEQRGALITRRYEYSFILNGETVFGQGGGEKRTTAFDSANAVFGPISIKNAESRYKTYDNARAILNVGQPYFTSTMAGYMELITISGYHYDKGEFAWIVNADGSISAKQWSGSSARSGYPYENAMTAYVIPTFQIDKKKWEECSKGYLCESAILKAQSMTYSGIAPSANLGFYNNNATERNLALLESTDVLTCPYDGVDLGDIPVNKTIKLPYYNASGVKYNTNSSRKLYISAVIIADNTVKYYGRLAEAESKQGEVALTVPSGLKPGEKYYLLLFEENASSLDNNTMTRPQIMRFTAVATDNYAVDTQEFEGTFEGVAYKGFYSIGYDSTLGKDIKYADNVYVTSGAEHLIEGGILKIPSTITVNGAEYRINSIGEGTYEKPFVPRDTDFTGISIPGTVKEIKPYAFYDSRIKELNIDATAISIGTGAFSKCKGLRVAGIKILSGKIGNRAFYGDNSLETINLSGNITVGKESFLSCKSLNSVIVKALSGTIKSGAFRGSAITELYLPNTVTADEYSFGDCQSLKVVETDMTTLKNNVFFNCAAISRIVFDDNVESVRENWGGYYDRGSAGRRKAERRFIYVKNPHTDFYFAKYGTGADMGVFSSLGARSASDYYYDYMRDVTMFYNKTSYPVEEGYSSNWSMENDKIYTEPGSDHRVYMNPTAMADNFLSAGKVYYDAGMYRTGKTGSRETDYALNVTFERADASTDAWAKALYEGRASYVPKSYQTGIKASFSGVVRAGGEIDKRRFNVSPVYSDAVITNEVYAENDFYIIKSADYNSIAEEDKTKEYFSGILGLIKASELPEGAEKEYEDVVVVAFSDEKMFAETVKIPVAARNTSLKPTEEFGTDKALENAIVSIREEKENISHELESKNEELLNVKDSLSAVTEQLDETTALLDEANTRVAEYESGLADKDDFIAELEAKIEEKESRITELEAGIIDTDGRIAELESEVEGKDGRITELESKLEEKDARITELESEVEEKDAQITELERNIREHKCETSDKNDAAPVDNSPGDNSGSVSSGSGSGNVASLSEYMSLYTQLYDYRQKVTDMESKNASLKSEVSSLNSDITGLSGEINGLNSMITGLNGEISGLREEILDVKNTDFNAPYAREDFPEGDTEYSVSGYNEPVSDPEYSVNYENQPYPYYDRFEFETSDEKETETESIQNTVNPVHVHIADTTLSDRARIVKMGEGKAKERSNDEEEKITKIVPSKSGDIEEAMPEKPVKTSPERRLIHADVTVAAKGISIVALILAGYALIIKRNRKKHYETLKSFLE